MNFQRVQLVTTGRGGERPTVADADLEISLGNNASVVGRRTVLGDVEREDSFVFRIAKGLSWATPNDILRGLAGGVVFLVSDEMVIPSGVARIDKKAAQPSFDPHVGMLTYRDNRGKRKAKR